MSMGVRNKFVIYLYLKLKSSILECIWVGLPERVLGTRYGRFWENFSVAPAELMARGLLVPGFITIPTVSSAHSIALESGEEKS